MGHPRFDFTRLSPAERAELAIALRNSLPVDSADPALTEEECAELDRRVEAFERDPAAGTPWTEVRERMRTAAERPR